MKHLWEPEFDEPFDGMEECQFCGDCGVFRSECKDPGGECPGYLGEDGEVWPVLDKDECLDPADPSCDLAGLFEGCLKYNEDGFWQERQPGVINRFPVYSFLVGLRQREVYPRRGADHYIDWTILQKRAEELLDAWERAGLVRFVGTTMNYSSEVKNYVKA